MTIPTIHTIDKITFPNPEAIRLKNNIPLYGFNGAKNDILRIDLIFNSGFGNVILSIVCIGGIVIFFES